MNYTSEETDRQVTIRCCFHDRPEMRCGEDKTAVALRGQWQGGDPDVDPHWIPVCADHDVRWDIDPDSGMGLESKYQLPRFPLTRDDEPTSRVYLDLSTSVITEREMNVIEACPVRVIRHEYGAWVHVPPVEPSGEDELSLDQTSALEPEDERELAYLEAEFERGVGRGIAVAHRINELRDLRDLGEDWSEFRNLLMVLRAARDLGADWINLDGDGHDTIPGLPTFEW